MNKKAVYGILLAVLLPLVCYFLLKKSTDGAINMPHRLFYDSVVTKVANGKEVNDTIWSHVSDFTMTNQLGQKVSWKDMEGKIIVVDFFFTHCPTICPRMTANMKKLQDAIKNSEKVGTQEANFIQFLSFSIDPERDSVPELKKWADRYQINPQNWWLLTGDKKKIYDLSINQMKLGIVDGGNVDTNFYHTDYWVLLDKDKVIRARKDEMGNPVFYHGLDSTDTKKLAEDIVLLSLEKDHKQKSFFAGKLELIAVVFVLAGIGLILLFSFLKKENKRI